MEKLKIRIYKNNDPQPDTTITIPFAAYHIIGKMISRMTTSTLENYGVDLNTIIEIAEEHHIEGPLLTIERHTQRKKTIISAE